MHWEMMDVQNQILREIADPRMKRFDVAQTYLFCIRSTEKPDFGIINRAIIARWSASGLDWIKQQAWKMHREAVGQLLAAIEHSNE